MLALEVAALHLLDVIGGVGGELRLESHLRAEWFTLIGRGTTRLCSDWLECPYAIKTQREASNVLSKGFGCLELCLHGIRELAERHLANLGPREEQSGP